MKLLTSLYTEYLSRPKDLSRWPLNCTTDDAETICPKTYMAEQLTILLLATIATFIIGIIVGAAITRTEGTHTFTRARLQLVMGAVVTTVWVITIVADILISSYSVSFFVHGIMGAVVGYLFSDEGLTFTLKGDD